VLGSDNFLVIIKIKKNFFAQRRRSTVKLWDHIKSQQEIGSYVLNIPEIKKTKETVGRTARTSTMSVKFGEFKMNPPKGLAKHNAETLQNLKMYAIYVLEIDPPDGETPVEWMLLTNQPLSTMNGSS